MAIRPLTAVGDDLYRWASGEISRVPTGYSFFDERMGGGVGTGELAVMLARTGVGKTWFLLNVAARTAHVPTIFFSMEMHDRYLLARLTSISTGMRTSFQEREISETGSSANVETTIERFPLLAIDDEPDRHTADMADACDRYAEEFGQRPKLLLVDYLGLVSHWEEDQASGVRSIGKALKQLARQTDTAVITAHQASRGEAYKAKGDPGQRVKNEGHRPLSMTDADFGGERDADYFWGMYRPALDPKMPYWDQQARANDMRFQFLKTRSDGGIHPLGEQHFYDPPTGRIEELNF